MPTLTFQQGVQPTGSYAGASDCMLFETNPTTNYDTGAVIQGSYATCSWDTTPRRYALLKFDIFGGGENQIPLGSKILSATLYLHISDYLAASYHAGNAHDALTDWTDSIATWNNWLDTPASGAVSGTDYKAADSVDLPDIFVGTAPDWGSCDVTANVQNWSDGTNNYGWLMVPSGASGTGFVTCHDATSSLRPYLVVEYSEQAVDILDAWSSAMESGYTMSPADKTLTPSAGTNRLALVVISAERLASIPGVNVASVTLGGQTMTQIGEASIEASPYSNTLWMGYLNEAGIQAMSGSAISVTWTVSPDNSSPAGDYPKVATAVYENVDQTTPIIDSSVNTLTGTTITPGAVAVGSGDQAVYGCVDGDDNLDPPNPNTGHNPPTGYTEEAEIVAYTGTNGHSIAVATRNARTASATENPSIVWDVSQRKGVVMAVLNAVSAAAGVAPQAMHYYRMRR